MSSTRRHALLGALAATVPLGGCGARPLSRALLPDAEDGAFPPPVLGVLDLDGTALGGDGLSGLDLRADPPGGAALTAVGDRGSWSTARLRLDDRGAPLELEVPVTGRLRGADGRPLAGTWQADAESLARLPDGGWLVGFERWHRILRYDRIDGPGRVVTTPPGLEQAPANGGLESLGVLADGRVLAIAEQLPAAGDPDLRAAWIGRWQNRHALSWQRLAYRAAPGFHPTDLCGLPDGGALVVERSFAIPVGFGGRLMRLRPAALRAPAENAVLVAEPVLDLLPPLPTDNWEGVSVFRHGNRLLAGLVSDDNAFALQRTLLMLLDLGEAN